MRKTTAATLSAIASFILLLCIAFTVVQIQAMDTVFYEKEFMKLNLGTSMGMTLGDLGESIRALTEYMSGVRDSIAVTVTVNGAQTTMYALEVEVVHMEEVRTVWRWFCNARNIALLLAALLYMLSVIWDRDQLLRTACVGYLWALGIFLFTLAFAGTWASLSFDSFWTSFHRLIFPNSENWLLPASSRMIQMLPSQLFFDLILRCGLYIMAVSFGIGAVAVLLLVLRHRKLKATSPEKPQTVTLSDKEKKTLLEGPDLLTVHKKQNMTVSQRKKLNEELEQERLKKQAEAEFGKKAAPAEEEQTRENARVKIEFAPYEKKEDEDEDED